MAACAACHAKIDPLGFGLENYDASGLFRLQESSRGQTSWLPKDPVIDASGELPDGRAFNGVAELQQILLEKEDMFLDCLSEKLLVYALGRGLEYEDRATVTDLAQIPAAERLSPAMVDQAIVQTKSFPNQIATGISLEYPRNSVMHKSWHLSRRTFLRAAGISMGLPLLEGMTPVGRRAHAADANALPRRLACFYVPNGVNNACWIPSTAGSNYELAPAHQPLQELREEFSIISGICHPDIESGHAGGDTFLTGAVLNGTPGYDYKNSISIDQLVAEHFSQYTRFPSMELSRYGGTGSARASHTMSFSRDGVPLAAESSPQRVFERLFTQGDAGSRSAQKARYTDERSILDFVQEDARALNRRLGKIDQRKLDEYLTAVRSVEKQVARSEAWLDIPKTSVDATAVNLDPSPNASDELQDYLRSMFDLIFLAFQTDTTRVSTFQIHREVTNQVFNSFLNFTERYHVLSHHGGAPDALEKLAKIDRFHIEQLGYFLAKLKATEEADGNMLDRTLVIYGSGMNNGTTGGHYGTNIPVLFAGGRGLGIKQGQHLAYRQKDHEIYNRQPVAPPLANLFTTALAHLEVPVEQFASSTGTISELAGS